MIYSTYRLEIMKTVKAKR